MWSSTGPSVSVPSTGTRMRSYTPMVSASPERGVQQEHVEPDDQRRDQHADGSGDGTRALIAHHAARPAEPEHGDDGERQLQAQDHLANDQRLVGVDPHDDQYHGCLLYTSDAADDLLCVDL